MRLEEHINRLLPGGVLRTGVSEAIAIKNIFEACVEDAADKVNTVEAKNITKINQILPFFDIAFDLQSMRNTLFYDLTMLQTVSQFRKVDELLDHCKHGCLFQISPIRCARI